MKLTEFKKYLLVCLMEENGEMIQEASKTYRFGEDNHHPKEHTTNIQKLQEEFNNVVAVAEMYGLTIDRESIEAKKSKVLHFMQSNH